VTSGKFSPLVSRKLDYLPLPFSKIIENSTKRKDDKRFVGLEDFRSRLSGINKNRILIGIIRDAEHVRHLLEHTVRYIELAPDPFKDFWR
jgi:hypothetical protein